MTAAYTRYEAEQEVLNLAYFVGTDWRHEIFQAAVLLLLGLGRRKHLDDLTKVSGYSKEFVQKCMKNLRNSGVWKGEDRRTWSDWKHPVSFMFDVMVALGFAERKAR